MAQDVEITLLGRKPFPPKSSRPPCQIHESPPGDKLKKLKIGRRRWWCCQNNDRKQIMVFLMQGYRTTPAVSHVKVGLQTAEDEETLVNKRVNCQCLVPLLG